MHLLFIFSALLTFPPSLLVDMNLTPAQNHELSEFSVQGVFDSAYYITIFVQYSFFQWIYKGSVYLSAVLLALIQIFFFSFLFLLNIITVASRISQNTNLKKSHKILNSSFPFEIYNAHIYK